MSFATDRDRFHAGLAAAAGVDPTALARTGTTVAPRSDRAGSGAIAAYWAGAHAILWCDPSVATDLGPLAHGERTIGRQDLAESLAPLGFELFAEADQYLLRSTPTLPPLPDGYQHRRLRAEVAQHVELIRAFTGRNDPDDVEEAALDDLDDFSEVAIDVVVDDGPDGEHLVAYASAQVWDWDPGFGDIAVLVHPDHRGRGLASWCSAACVHDLVAIGYLPLYRHESTNLGSAAVARRLGFEPVTSLAYHRRT